MALDQFFKPWQATGYRHQPASSPLPVTDTRFLGISEGRWNRKGEKAYYVACDLSVTLSEFARWVTNDTGGVEPRERDVFELEIALERVLDLRDPQVQAALSITGVMDFFDYETCQAYATLARKSGAQGILVPPMGALDRDDAWNLVVFTEAFSGRTPFINAHRHVRVVSVTSPHPA